MQNRKYKHDLHIQHYNTLKREFVNRVENRYFLDIQDFGEYTLSFSYLKPRSRNVSEYASTNNKTGLSLVVCGGGFTVDQVIDKLTVMKETRGIKSIDDLFDLQFKKLIAERNI